MRVTHLRLANVRAIEEAEFHFRPGFNLVAGVNGVGKTTVLDALRICSSRILPSITESRARSKSFEIRDLRGGFPFLEAELTFAIDNSEFRFMRREWREAIATDDVKNLENLRREILNSDRLRDRPRNLLRELDRSLDSSHSDLFLPSKAKLVSAARGTAVAPNCMFFGTNRSVASDSKTKARTIGGRSTAYAEGLDPRPLYVRQFADWLRAQEVLGNENAAARRHLHVLQRAVGTFLEDYDKLRPDEETSGALTIDRGGTSLEIAQLSDGERGVLALILDIARRLTQANPELEDPLSDGQAIVLIDEIELHLHPAWQRRIVGHLEKTFPNCQFIATTHSPQVVGEVEHDQIHILAHGEVYSPTHSYGVDSSRVLEEVMDADPRTEEVKELLSEISRKIGDDRYDDARNLLADLSGRLGEDDPEVIRIRTLLDFMTGEE